MPRVTILPVCRVANTVILAACSVCEPLGEVRINV